MLKSNKNDPKPGPALMAAREHRDRLEQARSALEKTETALADAEEALAELPTEPDLSGLVTRRQEILADLATGATDRDSEWEAIEAELKTAHAERAEWSRKVAPKKDRGKDTVEGLKRKVERFRMEFEALKQQTAAIAVEAVKEEAEALGAEVAAKALDLAADLERLVSFDRVGQGVPGWKSFVGVGAVNFHLPSFSLKSFEPAKAIGGQGINNRGHTLADVERERFQTLGVVFPLKPIPTPKKAPTAADGVVVGYSNGWKNRCSACVAKKGPLSDSQPIFEKPDAPKTLICSTCGLTYGGAPTPTTRAAA